MNKVKKGLHPDKQQSQSAKTVRCRKSGVMAVTFFFSGSVIK